MLKIDEETHDRFMRYKAAIYAEKGEQKTVGQVLNSLLDKAGALPSKKQDNTSI